MKKIIFHVAEVALSQQSGMGRVAWHWKNEFEQRGYDFVHIGPAEVGSLLHKGLFPNAAYQTYKRCGRVASLLLVHEPASGAFINQDVPTVVFSHGVERRAWNLALNGKDGTNKKISWRTKVFFPLWRLRQCDLGLRKAVKLLLINEEDRVFTEKYYHRKSQDIYVFKNGINKLTLNEIIQPKDQITVGFLGSWIERKGIRTLVEAAQILYEQGWRLNWLLAGTNVDSESVLKFFPSNLHSSVEIIQCFDPENEESILARCNIFVLPSFFEGQSLALLQAMAAGRCCITTNCCGQRDLIQNGDNGLLYEPGNACELASLIEQCLKDEQLRLNLGRNAKLLVKDRSWKTVSAEVVDQIEKVLI